MTTPAPSPPDLDAVVRQGWQDHAEDPGCVLARLPAAVDLVRTPAHATALAGLVVHVAGEHLGLWDDGVALVVRLQGLPHHDPASADGKALARALAVLHTCRGDAAAAARWTAAARSGGDVPEASDRVRILAVAAAALAGQARVEEAARAFAEALALAAYGPGPQDPAARALAVTGNNLAVELERRAARTPAEDALLLEAARAGRRFWEVAGTWREVERAEYRLARAHLAAGRAREALAHAEACRALVAAHGDEPLEAFFAHEARALARQALAEDPAADRAAAAAALGRVEDATDRGWLVGELEALDARLAGRTG